MASLKRIGWILLVGWAISAVIVGCQSQPAAEVGPTPTNPQPRGTVTPLPTATLDPSVTVAPTPTFEPPTPEAKPTQPLTALIEPIPEPPLPGSQAIEIAVDLVDPVGFAAAPDGRIFFTEKTTGNVRVIVDGQLLPDPVLNLPTGSSGEQGVIGIALDPDFENNHHIWITHTLPARENNGEKVNRVIRFTEVDNVATEVEVALTTPNSSGDGSHNAGNLAFDQDGLLYLTLGDDNEYAIAQWADDPRGKIHRFYPTIPLTPHEDNPYYDGDDIFYDGIYAIGFRNPFDLVVDPLQPDKTVIFATENGPSCEDEVNLIERGRNYGWHADFDCDLTNGNFPEMNTGRPLLYWTPTSAPTGITVYTGDDFPEWYGDIFFCTYIDAKLHRLELNATRDGVASHHTVDGLFCQTDVFNAPDGGLYYVEGGGYGPGTLKKLVRTS